MEAIASVPTAKEMRLFNTGQAWRVQDLGANAVARYGSPYWLVHRGDFHQVLVQALAERAPDAVRVGARCIDFEQDADGVTLLLEDGERVRGDVLIGATACTRGSARRCSVVRAPLSPASWRGAASCDTVCPHGCVSNTA